MSEPGVFANESVPYAPFKAVGTTYSGMVLRTSQVQGRKFVPPNQRAAGVQGELETWPDGKPKMVKIITIQTDLRDPEIPGDDGQRSIWCSGKQMEDAVKKAVRDSGASREGIVRGGHFTMKFTHTTPNDWTDTPTKHYEVTYRPPEPGSVPVAADDPWSQPQNPFPAPAANLDPWGTQQQPQAPQQPQTAAQAYVQQATPADTTYGKGGLLPEPQQPARAPQQPAQQLDTSALPEEARALVEAMLAKQQGGTQ